MCDVFVHGNVKMYVLFQKQAVFVCKHQLSKQQKEKAQRSGKGILMKICFT